MPVWEITESSYKCTVHFAQTEAKWVPLMHTQLPAAERFLDELLASGVVLDVSLLPIYQLTDLTRW